jgi:hypothetical protein
MFGQIFKKYFKPGTIHVFVFSFMVFIVLNVIENVIHYNIGKFHNGVNGVNGVNYFTGYHFTNPSRTDWVRIIVIMLVFAFLQGAFTSYFSLC